MMKDTANIGKLDGNWEKTSRAEAQKAMIDAPVVTEGVEVGLTLLT